MSFHKRWLKEENLRSIFSTRGIEGLKMTMRADAFICEDKFSSEMIDIFNTCKEEDLEEKINEHFNVSRIIS